MSAGSAIVAVRTAMGLSQRQLAARAGVNHGYLSVVESGQRTPSSKWMRRVTTALGERLGERA